jgi:hypothetical protein
MLEGVVASDPSLYLNNTKSRGPVLISSTTRTLLFSSYPEHSKGRISRMAKTEIYTIREIKISTLLVLIRDK